MAHDVFVSHSSKDKPTADAVCAMLESQGIRCWVAPRDITPGMDWGDAIVQAVKGARVMVLVFSANANESPQIKREVERAVNKGIPVIPLRIEDVAPTASLEYFISTPHWLDAFTPPLETHLRYLAQIIQQIIGAQPAKDAVISPPGSVPVAREAEKSPAPKQAPPAPAGVRRRSPAVALLAGAVALLAVLLAGWWFGIERPRREESRRQIEAERTMRAQAELESARMVEEQRKLKEAMETAKRAEEKRLAAEAAARFAEEKRQAEDAARIALEKQKAEEAAAAKRAEEKQIADAKAAEAARLAAVKKEPEVAPVKVGPKEQNEIQTVRASVPEPGATKKPATVFELIKEANLSLGEESKGNLFYARSERSVGELTPSTWKLGFYDPATMLKVTELKFRDGAKSDVTRPGALLEMYNLQKVLDRKKLIVDSDQALQTAAKDTLLNNLTLRTSEMKLEMMDGRPAWRIKFWAARRRNPIESAEVGEIWISSEDGKVLRRTLNPRRAD